MRRGGLLALATAVVLTISASSAETLDVFFIDVGHGDAILIDLGDWEALLDAGRGYSTTSEELLAVLSKQVADSTVELAILSHYHADHYGGFEDVLAAGYQILEFWTSEDPNPDTQGETYSRFVRALAEAGLVRERKTCCEASTIGSTTWTILGPSRILTSSKNDNENSLVVLLEFGGFGFLFTGDIEGGAEQQLLRTHAPDCSLILKVAHHGSDTSTSAGFLDWASPELAIISANCRQPPVVNRLWDSGIPFYTTAAHGTIHIRIEHCGCWVETGHAPGLVECCLEN